MTNKKPKTKLKLNLKIKRVFLLLFSIGIMGLSTGLFLLYGPYSWFRNTLITSAMTTMNHQYLARWFYSEDFINRVLANNHIIEPNEDTNPDLIDINGSNNNGKYSTKYERDLFEGVKKDTIYKIINIKGPGYKGFVVAVYDPSKVKVGVSSKLGVTGQNLMTIAKNNKALVAMNGGGFYDPTWNGNGAIPHGTVIKDGKILYEYEDAQVGGGFIGFNKENVLILGRMTSKQALAKGLRDAIEFGPFLVVNGKPSFIKGDGGWGTAPRSAIGQRKDGVVLFVVINGRTLSSPGADMVDMTDIMMNYGAYNAANLDGGTSSALIEGTKLINDPVNSNGKHGVLRNIPTAWIVTE